jgi:hypothetical protein
MGSMVRSKLLEAVAVPSLTVIVIVTVPLWLPAGLIVTVLFAPAPPNVILATGTNTALLEDAETVRLPAGVSLSLTVNAIGSVAVFSDVV